MDECEDNIDHGGGSRGLEVGPPVSVSGIKVGFYRGVSQKGTREKVWGSVLQHVLKVSEGSHPEHVQAFVDFAQHFHMELGKLGSTVADGASAAFIGDVKSGLGFLLKKLSSSVVVWRDRHIEIMPSEHTFNSCHYAIVKPSTSVPYKVAAIARSSIELSEQVCNRHQHVHQDQSLSKMKQLKVAIRFLLEHISELTNATLIYKVVIAHWSLWLANKLSTSKLLPLNEGINWLLTANSLVCRKAFKLSNRDECVAPFITVIEGQCSQIKARCCDAKSKQVEDEFEKNKFPNVSSEQIEVSSTIKVQKEVFGFDMDKIGEVFGEAWRDTEKNIGVGNYLVSTCLVGGLRGFHEWIFANFGNGQLTLNQLTTAVKYTKRFILNACTQGENFDWLATEEDCRFLVSLLEKFRSWTRDIIKLMNENTAVQRCEVLSAKAIVHCAGAFALFSAARRLVPCGELLEDYRVPLQLEMLGFLNAFDKSDLIVLQMCIDEVKQKDSKPDFYSLNQQDEVMRLAYDFANKNKDMVKTYKSEMKKADMRVAQHFDEVKRKQKLAKDLRQQISKVEEELAQFNSTLGIVLMYVKKLENAREEERMAKEQISLCPHDKPEEEISDSEMHSPK